MGLFTCFYLILGELLDISMLSTMCNILQKQVKFLESHNVLVRPRSLHSFEFLWYFDVSCRIIRQTVEILQLKVFNK